MARARRGFILIAVTSFVASVAGPFAARLFDAGLGLLAIVGILLVAIPQWRRVPSRGAVAGLVVGGLIVAAAGVMSVFAEDRNYGHPRWSVSDAGVVVIAVVLIVCGVLAGRRRKRLIAGGRQELSPATEAPPMSHSPTARTPSLPEVGISALLVLPTLPMYYFLPTAPLYVRNAAGESLVYNAHWSSSLWAGIAICVYLTTVVGLRARSNTRRVAAVVVAIVATAAFWVFRVAERNFIEFTPVADLEPRAHQLFLQTYAAMILFVAAWGIARRRHPLWVVGLLASMGLVGLAMMYYYGQLANPGWLSFWAIDVGVFVASCLACWVFDGIGGRSRHRARTPDRANGAATT